MNCHHVHEQIRHILAQDAKPSAQLQQHMQSCAQCREYWQEQALEQWLPEILKVPVPEHLHTSILAGVAKAQPAATSGYKWPAAMAMAASLFVLILLGPFTGFKSGPNVQVVEVSVGQVEQVQLLVASAQDYLGANITVSMSAGMSLDAAGQVSEFSMQTSLRKGKNMLALPIYLVHEDGGIIQVEISSGEGTKQMQLNVKAKPLAKTTKATLSI